MIQFNNEGKKRFPRNGYIILKNLINDELVDKVLDSLEKFKNKKTIYFTQSTHIWVSSNNITEEGFLIDSIQTPTKQYFCGDLKNSIKNLLSSEKISEILKQISGYKYFINWQNMLFDKSTGTTDHADTWY